MTQQTTGLVLTYNGDKYLEKTLKSLDFCDQLLVVDSGSTDATIEIAKNAGARVVHHDFENLTAQFLYALTLVETPWVVDLDQDEYLSPELRREVIEHLKDPGDNVGFFVRRCNYYYNRFLKHGSCYPDRLFRVFRKDSIEVTGTIPFYEFHPKGKAGRIEYDIMHFPYVSLHNQAEKINYYTNIQARQMLDDGKKGGLFKAVTHSAFRFIRNYIFRRGFMDGQAGLIYSFFECYNVFLKYTYLEQLHRQSENRD